MDFWRTVLVLVRRWYVALPAFLLAIAVAALVYASIPTRYTSYSVIVLTVPTTGPTQSLDPQSVPQLTNPLMNFGDGLNNAASILIQVLSTPEVAQQVGDSPDGKTEYQVTNGTTNPELLARGPFVYIQGDSTSPTQAQAIVQRVVETARTELVGRQQILQAPPTTYITLSVVVPPTAPAALRSGKLRPAIAAVGVGGVVSLTVAFAAESMLEARARRRSARSAATGVAVRHAGSLRSPPTPVPAPARSAVDGRTAGAGTARPPVPVGREPRPRPSGPVVTEERFR